MAIVPQPDPSESKTFEIGLVMAGAVSAGAYTAGVVDYLIEKLEAYQSMQDQSGADPSRPSHKVVLRVMAGASAGGICSALAVAQLLGNYRQDRLPAGFDPKKSVLYNTWVSGIDISDLLKTRDLEDKNKPVASLLDCTRLDELTSDALDLEPIAAEAYPAFLADPLDLYLSVANTRGVPYGIRAGGGGTGYGHEMTLHADRLHFQVVNHDTAPYWSAEKDSRCLARGTLSNSDRAWGALGVAALATSAFPIGLKARTITASTNDYNLRLWPVPLETAPCQDAIRIPPLWQDIEQSNLEDNYKAVCVDGGLMNNEPFELARRTLAGTAGRNPRDPKEANRAVIIVDPFPDQSSARSAGYWADTGMLSMIPRMLRSLINQSRFKPEDLSLAGDADTFSRFLISPRRTEPDGSATVPAIQSAALGGFGGFFARAFREHDYELGRRNCERFLKEWFYLDPKNPVFGGWTGDGGHRKSRGGMDSLPIIPIDTPGLEEVALPARVRPADVIDVQLLEKNVRGRLKPFGKRLIAQNTGGLVGWGLKTAWSFGLHKTVRSRIMKAIKVAFAMPP